jgi:hypothetical protein
LNWIPVDSCEAANLLGWFLGSATGLLADIVLLVLVATSPALGPGRVPAPDRWDTLRLSLKYSLLLLLPIWCIGGVYAGRDFIVCYLGNLSAAAAAMIGVVLLLAMLSAANQIGRRSVR